jgi:hypothetical protein
MVDGHTVAMRPEVLDGKNPGSGGVPNNAWWNGRFDPGAR